MKLEDELRRTLQREQPSEDFAAHVVAKIESTSRRPISVWDAKRRFAGWAAAATIAAATGSIYYAHRQQIAEAERVRNEAVVGLRIASAKLNEVHERLLQISSQKRLR
jgi:hypothetical protein